MKLMIYDCKKIYSSFAESTIDIIINSYINHKKKKKQLIISIMIDYYI